MVKTKKTEKAASKASLADYRTILHPVITEKASRVGEGEKKVVVFHVHPDATKTEIKKAVQSVFNVEVAAVRTCNYLGKIKRTARSVGRRNSYKKAYVSLKAGQTINLIEGV